MSTRPFYELVLTRRSSGAHACAPVHRNVGVGNPARVLREVPDEELLENA